MSQVSRQGGGSQSSRQGGGSQPAITRRTLVVEYDVSELSEEEIERLMREATTQAEASNDHPSVNARARLTNRNWWRHDP